MVNRRNLGMRRKTRNVLGLKKTEEGRSILRHKRIGGASFHLTLGGGIIMQV